MANTMNNKTFGFATLGIGAGRQQTNEEAFPLWTTTWWKTERVTVIGHSTEQDFPTPIKVLFADGRIGFAKRSELGLTAENAKRLYGGAA